MSGKVIIMFFWASYTIYEDLVVKVFGVFGNFGNAPVLAAAACKADIRGSQLFPNYKNNGCRDDVPDINAWPVTYLNSFNTSSKN